ncbi:MAG: PAS domain-containing protein [Actinomycetota bacterium]
MTTRNRAGMEPRRPTGLRDLLVATVVVAALFTMGRFLRIFEQVDHAIAMSTFVAEILALGALLIVALTVLAARRWRHAIRETDLRRRAEATYRALVEGSPAVTYTWDAVKHRHLYVSPQIETMFGYSPKDWGEDMWIRAVHPDDEAGLLAASAAADNGELAHFFHEYRIHSADGSVHWIHDESRNVGWAADGTPTLAQGVMTDITAAREADARASEAEARFRTIVERVPAVAYVWDGADEPGSASAGYISPQIEGLLGYSAEEWLDHPDAWGAHVHPEDLDGVLRAWSAAVAAGDTFTSEYRIRTADGSWVVLRDEAAPVATGERGQPVYQGVMLDVTARRAAEDALREADARARSLLENLPVTAYMADYETEPPYATYDRWIGPGVTALLGWSQDEWLADDDAWVHHLHPEDRDQVLAAWREAIATRIPFVGEYRMLHRDGHTVWVHEESRTTSEGSRVRADGIYSDITERKLAESGRQDAEVRFQALVDQLPAVVYREDAETGRTSYVSRHVEQMSGYSPDEWLATEDMWIHTLHPEDRDRVLALDEEDGDTWSAEYRSIARDGRVAWLANRAELIRDDDGTPRFWQGLIFDITERKETEERIRAAEERYRSLVEEIPVVVYTDAVDELSTALYVSPMYARITGYPAVQRMADPGLWARILHPEDRERVLAESERTNQTGDPFDIEYRIVAANGRTVWLHDHARQVLGPEGIPVWQGILEDITERRGAEQDLAEATRRFQTLVEQIPAMTYIEDAVTEREIYVSPQVEAMLGYTPQDWIEMDGWEVATHPEDRDRVLAEDARSARDEDVFRAEYRLIAKDGHVVWVREEALPVADASGAIEHWQGVRFDITAEKESEQQLRAAEERYRLVVEELPAIAYVDERRDDGPSRTWPCIYVSPQVETILGFTPEEWTHGPETWDDMIHPDDLERAAEADARHYELGEPVDVELRVKSRDGTWRWLRDQAVIVRDETGEPRWSQGIWLDVTERKQAELALLDAEARYRGIVEHVPAAIYLDRADGSMQTVYVSPQIEALTGYSPEAWIERPGLWESLIEPEDRERVMGPHLGAIAARDPWVGEYRIRHADGRTIWMHEEIAHIPGSDSDPGLVQGVLYDVTERKLAEQALRDSEQRERQAAERLRALDEMKNTFLAAVSHELRSPLTSILGLSLTLERAPEIGREDRDDLLVRLAANARKLDRLLKDLLDIDRLNRGIVEPQYRVVDVGALARRTIEHLEQLAGRHVLVETDPVVLAVDPAKVERIIENLVLNAVRHSEADRTIWLKVSSEGAGVSIIVEDDGSGVPEDLRDVLFEPFRQGPTASPHAPGTGIGLSLVARFAELHDGRVWIEDRPGGGASFHVFLPGHDTEGSALAAEETLTPTGTG